MRGVLAEVVHFRGFFREEVVLIEIPVIDEPFEML